MIHKFHIKPKAHAAPMRLVAAIRYDLDVSKMPLMDVVRRYDTLLNATTVRDIAARRIYGDVEPSRRTLTWW